MQRWDVRERDRTDGATDSLPRRRATGVKVYRRWRTLRSPRSLPAACWSWPRTHSPAGSASRCERRETGELGEGHRRAPIYGCDPPQLGKGLSVVGRAAVVPSGRPQRIVVNRIAHAQTLEITLVQRGCPPNESAVRRRAPRCWRLHDGFAGARAQRQTRLGISFAP